MAKDTTLCLYPQQKTPLLACIYNTKKQNLHGDICKLPPAQPTDGSWQEGLSQAEMRFNSALPDPPVFSSPTPDLSSCSATCSRLKPPDIEPFGVGETSRSQLLQCMEVLLHRELPRVRRGVRQLPDAWAARGAAQLSRVVWRSTPRCSRSHPCPAGKGWRGDRHRQKASSPLLLPEPPMHVKTSNTRFQKYNPHPSQAKQLT